jgi:hypothetical protein
VRIHPFWRCWTNGAMVMAPGCFAATLWRLTGSLVLKSFKGPAQRAPTAAIQGKSRGRTVGSPARCAAVRRYSFLRRVQGALGHSVVTPGDARGATQSARGVGNPLSCGHRGQLLGDLRRIASDPRRNGRRDRVPARRPARHGQRSTIGACPDPGHLFAAVHGADQRREIWRDRSARALHLRFSAFRSAVRSAPEIVAGSALRSPPRRHPYA